MRGFGAAWKPLAAGNPPNHMARYDIVCLHTMVGNLTSTWDYFKQGGWSGTESHFGVGGKWGMDSTRGLDGVAWQFVDSDYRADANLEGNPRILSIETADNAPATPAGILPWTPKQLEGIAQLTAKLCKTYDIPAVLIPDSKPDRRGIGYHRQGCEHSEGIGEVPGFLVAGGERWSTSKGKECPGPARIAQIPLLIARVRAILNPTPATPATEDDDMEELIHYGSGVHLRTGMVRAPVKGPRTDPESPYDELVERLGEPRQVTQNEYKMYAPWPTVLAILGSANERAAQAVSSAATANELATDVSAKLDQVLTLLTPSATPQQPSQ